MLFSFPRKQYEICLNGIKERTVTMSPVTVRFLIRNFPPADPLAAVGAYQQSAQQIQSSWGFQQRCHPDQATARGGIFALNGCTADGKCVDPSTRFARSG